MDPGRGMQAVRCKTCSALFENRRTRVCYHALSTPEGSDVYGKGGQVLGSRPANNHYDQTVGETGIHLVPERFVSI